MQIVVGSIIYLYQTVTFQWVFYWSTHNMLIGSLVESSGYAVHQVEIMYFHMLKSCTLCNWWGKTCFPSQFFKDSLMTQMNDYNQSLLHLTKKSWTNQVLPIPFDILRYPLLINGIVVTLPKIPYLVRSVWFSLEFRPCLLPPLPACWWVYDPSLVYIW